MNNLVVETFYSNGTGDECSEHGWPEGWYWAAGQAGCLYDIGPEGPFKTSVEAQRAAELALFSAE